MSSAQIFQIALNELLIEYDISPNLLQTLQKNQVLKEQINFVCHSMDVRQKILLDAFKKNFQCHLSEIDSTADRSCGFIIKCYGNGYREFCDLPEFGHDDFCQKTNNIIHAFQKKNINNIIDAKYQEGILTIINLISEIKASLSSSIISQYLLQEAKAIKVNYENGDELRKYDELMLNDAHYFRSNYLINGEVTYHHSKLDLDQ